MSFDLLLQHAQSFLQWVSTPVPHMQGTFALSLILSAIGLKIRSTGMYYAGAFIAVLIFLVTLSVLLHLDSSGGLVLKFVGIGLVLAAMAFFLWPRPKTAN